MWKNILLLPYETIEFKRIQFYEEIILIYLLFISNVQGSFDRGSTIGWHYRKIVQTGGTMYG